MTKKELTDQLASGAGVSQGQASALLDSLGTIVTQVIKDGGNVTLPGLGKFEGRYQEAKTVKTFGVEKDVPAKTVPKFKASTGLKDAVA